MPVIPGGLTLEVSAVTRAELPPDGELALGPVRLPAGRSRVLDSLAQSDAPVAWLTDEPVPEPGRVWLELSRACAGTGLMPFVAAAIEGRVNRNRPWGSGELDEPQDAALADDLDPGQLLRQHWEWEWPPPDGDGEELEWVAEKMAPFGREFPGLAPAITESLDPGHLAEGPSRLRRPERIGLVPAARPADVLPAIGWIPANWTDGMLPVTAIVRSWEDRFGARLVQVENGAITLLVERPPRDQAAAQRIAAELVVFADEIHLRRRWALTTVSEITTWLVDTPMWRCWWD